MGRRGHRFFLGGGGGGGSSIPEFYRRKIQILDFQRLASLPSAENGKGKKAISESTANSQRIGITLKLEAIKTTLSVQGQRRVLLM